MANKKHKKEHKKKPLKNALWFSGLIHLIIIISLVIMPPEWMIKTKPRMDVVWVALPKGSGQDVQKKVVEPEKESQKKETKAIKPLTKPSKTAMPKPEKEKPKKKKVVRKKRSRIDSALSKIDKRLKTRNLEKEPTSGEGSETGTSNKPVKDKVYQAALLKYRALVRSRIMSRWNPPDSGNASSASILVYISKNGRVISARWAKKSNNESINQSAMRAVKSTQFPTPPDPLKWEAYNEGFSVVFNPAKR